MNSDHPSFVATVIQEIKNTLRGEPHTFNEIRILIEDARIDETDFLEVIQQHHRFLHESVTILLDKESSVPEKQIHLDRFLRLLEMHGRAEEETLYRSLIRHTNHEAHREGLVGQDEHILAFQLAGELKTTGFLAEWNDDIDAKVHVLANLVSSHMLEEEGVMFPIARKSLLPGEMQVLASDYLDLCEFYLDGEQRILTPMHISWRMT